MKQNNAAIQEPAEASLMFRLLDGMEISYIVETAMQNGIPEEHIPLFTRVAIELRESAEMTAVERICHIFPKLAINTGMPMDQFDRLGSATLALRSKIPTETTTFPFYFGSQIAEMLEMALVISQSATQFGLSPAQILAFSTSLCSVGLHASKNGFHIAVLLDQIQAVCGKSEFSDFSKIADMPEDTFANLLANDAARAIAAFIEGVRKLSVIPAKLEDSLRNGGITMPSVTKTLVDASKAGAILTEYFEIATQAFEENTELFKNETNERHPALTVAWQSMQKYIISLIHNIEETF